MYPVDLQDGDHSDLTSEADQYLCSLEKKHDDGWFHSSPSLKVLIKRDNVRRLRVFDDDQPDCALLVLHVPDEPTQVVALYLFGQWWRLDDVLRTSSRSRTGLFPLRSIMERVIMFLLSQVVDMPSQEGALFSLHPHTESGKLLWRDGEAVGFYTVKHKGSLCGRFLGWCYPLPVLDTVLVRRYWRRRGLGLHMLEDFCCSFSEEDVLGVSAPLSPGMVAVCRCFLKEHKEHRERLHEVEAPGGWTRQRNIWLSIRLGHYRHSINEDRSPSAGETVRNEEDSSQKKPINNWEQDVASVNTCDTDTLSPLQVDISEQHIKSCDTNLGGDFRGTIVSGTGCSPGAHTDDPDRGQPPTKSIKSLHRKYKSSESADPHNVQLDPQEMLKSAKRIRRTLS